MQSHEGKTKRKFLILTGCQEFYFYFSIQFGLLLLPFSDVKK